MIYFESHIPKRWQSFDVKRDIIVQLTAVWDTFAPPEDIDKDWHDDFYSNIAMLIFWHFSKNYDAIRWKSSTSKMLQIDYNF